MPCLFPVFQGSLSFMAWSLGLENSHSRYSVYFVAWHRSINLVPLTPSRLDAVADLFIIATYYYLYYQSHLKEVFTFSTNNIHHIYFSLYFSFSASFLLLLLVIHNKLHFIVPWRIFLSLCTTNMIVTFSFIWLSETINSTPSYAWM